MKKMKLWALAAIFMCCSMACVNNGKSVAPITKEDSDSAKKAELGQHSALMYAAMNRYLTDSVASHYAPGELCIPCPTVVSCDQHGTDSVTVLGDFWVFNYNVVGDTLKMVSGGSHPGKMILQFAEDRYEVTSFEQVEDGSNFLPSAKRIFGDMYEAFHSINSDQEAREQARAEFIAKYVKDNNLNVHYYQDYGWPAKQIAVNN